MNPSVLVVDDDPAIADLLAEALDGEGYEVRRAADGQQALDAIEADPVDVIISDVVMPQVNGLALTERLRDADNRTPVVLMSGMLGGIALPGVTFVRKPFDVDRVLDVVRDAIADADR
jgi:two-component system, OmpR family, response regulator MprA